MREREQRRGRSEGELRESERGRGERGGECVAPSGASSGEQVSRRWPELFGRAPRLASAYWQRKKRTRGGGGLARWPGCWLGRPGEAQVGLVGARQLTLSLSFCFYSVLYFSSVFVLFNLFCHCFEFGFETNSIYFASDNIFRS